MSGKEPAAEKRQQSRFWRLAVFVSPGTASVSSGKVDIGGNVIIQTPERDESVDFSVVTCDPQFTIIMRAETIAELTGDTSIL